MRKGSILVTPEDVDVVKGNANFGESDPYVMIVEGVLKCVTGYSSGNTVTCMMQELGLVTKDRKRLTKKGKRCLWEWYHRMYRKT
jgi:hypothetical protein